MVEHRMDLSAALAQAVTAISDWQAGYGAFDEHPIVSVADKDVSAALEAYVARLTDPGQQYPFFHPRYAGQMLKPPHPVAVVGYLAAMLINPNNHALDGGPATAHMEKEVVADLAAMFGFTDHLGHLTSSGTIANLEALWVARHERPGGVVAVSRDAHYTHVRICEVLGMEAVVVDVDAHGRMDLDHLATVLEQHDVGLVVATLGTTGLGAIDPLDEILPMARKAGARVHVDAAYGGFFALVADDAPDGVSSAPFVAIREADSVVVDPHKHGLQPYGCGAVLFADPAVGRHYQHDSPYTYFTSDELHLGEISLECSRAGAAAGALWLTAQVFPLTSDGLGSVLRPGIRAARRFHEALASSPTWQSVQAPELDIVGYATRRDTSSAIDADTTAVFTDLANRSPSEQWHLATYAMSVQDLARRGIDVVNDNPRPRILRSVFMKPEHEYAVDDLLEMLESTL